MAKNRVYEKGNRLTVPIAGKVSGEPVVYGQIPGVCLIDTNPDGDTVLQTDGVFNLSVKGVDNVPADTAIAAGDIIYLDGAELNVDSVNGVRFGYALAAVVAGATTEIPVKVGY